MGECVLRIELDGLLEALDGKTQSGWRSLMPVMTPFKVQFVGLGVFGRSFDCVSGVAEQRRHHRLHDRRDNLVLNLEHIRHLPIVALRPQLIAVFRVNQLRCDPEPGAGPAHAAFYKRRDFELAADLPDIQIAAAKTEG